MTWLQIKGTLVHCISTCGSIGIRLTLMLACSVAHVECNMTFELLAQTTCGVQRSYSNICVDESLSSPSLGYVAGSGRPLHLEQMTSPQLCPQQSERRGRFE